MKILSNKAVRLLIVIAAAVASSVLLTAVKDREYSDWVPTEAVVTDWKTTDNVKRIIYFKYDVNGAEYTGQDVFGGNLPQESIGDIVTVWYDPEEPSRVMRSDVRPDAGLWTYAPFFLAVPFSLFVLTDGNKRKGKDLR